MTGQSPPVNREVKKPAAWKVRQKAPPGEISTASMVELLRKAYEAGDKYALLAAALWLLPDEHAWVRHDFHAALMRFLSGLTLNEAFGIGRKKGQHQATARWRRFVGPKVAFTVYQAHRAGWPINRALFAAIGRHYKVGAGQVADCWRRYGPDIKWLKAEPEAKVRRELDELVAHLLATEPDPRKRVAGVRAFLEGKPRG